MSNLDKIKNKDIKIVLGGRERTLAIDFNTYAELEEMYGNIDSALIALQKGSLKAVRAFVYAALKDDDENLTLKQVGKMMSIESMSELTNVLNLAVTGSLPDAPTEEETKN